MTVSLRNQFIFYLIVIHLVLGGLAIYVLQDQRIWLLGIEGFFVFSFFAGFHLIKKLSESSTFVQTTTELLKERDFQTRFVPSGHREVDQLVAIYNQMVDHLREERVRIQELDHFLDRLITASPSGILILDFDKRVTLVNPRAEDLLGYSSCTLLGKRLSEVDLPFAELLETLPVGASEVIAFQSRRRVKCWKSQFMDRGFPRTFLTMEELTEELRKSEKAAYDKLIRMMSHEVGNTTGAVTSLLDSCLIYGRQLSADDKSDFESALSVIIARAEHLNTFVGGFADVVRLPDPEFRLTDIHRLLEELVVLIQPECKKRGITVQWRIESSIPPVRMDPYQMERALVNILKNAIEAIGQQGTITLVTGTDHGRTYVAVEDDGCGITPETGASIFTPFFSTKEQGHGLGLTLVQEILTRHGFDFTLESIPGGPTCFTIWFQGVNMGIDTQEVRSFSG